MSSVHFSYWSSTCDSLWMRVMPPIHFMLGVPSPGAYTLSYIKSFHTPSMHSVRYLCGMDWLMGCSLGPLL